MARRTATEKHNQPTGPVTVSLPHLWSPRSYQKPLFLAMPANAAVTPKRTRKRLVTVWHRRAGKDLTCISLMAREMSQRVGYYVYIFPQLNQAKPIIWDGKDGKGIPFLDRFPASLILEKNETELQIVLKPLPGQPGYGVPGARGSIFQLRGADEPDRLRGINPVGVAFSEYAQTNPLVWNEIIQPVLEENGGWAMFNFTPKGRNHACKLHEAAKANPGMWFDQLLTIEDTFRDAPGESGEPVVTQAQIDEMRKDGVAEEIIQQEFYCSFEGFLRGTIFGDLILQARRDHRIGHFPWNANQPVGTMWDIGRYDHTAIWFYQKRGESIQFIDYYEDRLKGADFYAKLCKDKPYLLTKQILPHDAKVKGFTASQSTEEFLSRALRGVTVAEKTSVQAQIDITRRMFSRFCFDEVKCAKGLEHIENYRRKFDDKLQDYSGDPIHDEHSHGSSALMTGAIGGLEYPLEFRENSRMPVMAESHFDVFENASVN